MSAESEAIEERVERVGPYVLGELLGEGGAARVYAASDARGREVALKVLKRSAGDDPTGSARLVREAEVLAALDHPGLVRVLDVGRDARDQPYLVLERVRGRSLRARLDAEGPLTPAEAWRIARSVALALRAAHAAGVLHRDLTPSNVLDAGERPKLGDFGLARRANDPRLSREGASTGTPAYMAPEQWWGAAIDERTDVYGLGAILYECLSGQPPWHGDPAEILHRVATGEPPPLRNVEPAVSAFVRRTLAREPGQRPADVERFIAEGDRAFGHRERRLPLERILLAAGVLAATVALGFGGSHDPRQWIREAGAGGYAVLLAALLAAILAPRLRAWWPLVNAAPLFAGATVFVTGMHVVMGHVASAPAERRFELFHLGFAEATSGWFLGATLSTALFAAEAGRIQPADDARSWRPKARALLGVVACVIAAILAAEAGAVALAALAVVLLVLGVPARRPDAALAAAYAIGAFALLAWVRLESESARLFEADLTRAARAAALTRLDASSDAIWMVGIVAVLAPIGAADWRGVRAWPRARVLGALAAEVALLALLIGPWLVSRAERSTLFDELAPRLSVWNELDPPLGVGRGPARLGPTLQLGRRRVAVDGADVVPIEALDGLAPTGPLLVAEQLGPRVQLGGPGPELVLAADASLAWRAVDRALGAAYDLGVRRVDLLLSTGPPAAIDPSAPPESSIVLPRDLRSMEIALAGPDDPAALRPDPRASYRSVVELLADRTVRSLAIGRPP